MRELFFYACRLLPDALGTAQERPQEEYNITLKMVKLTLNKPLKADQFQLEAPPGAVITELK